MLEGIDKLREDLKEQAGEAVEHLAETMRDDARSSAPTVTGTLRDSIDYSVNGNTALVGIDQSERRPGGGRPARYAGFVEYGTSAHGPQPFMRPAFHRAKANLEKEAAKKLKLD